MISTLLPVLATAVMISSVNHPIPKSSSSASPTFVFTRVMPENNFVVHTVTKDETLKAIALKFYGKEDYWKNLWNINPSIKNPDELIVASDIKVILPKPKKIEDLTKELEERYEDFNKKTEVYAYVPPRVQINYIQSDFEEVYKTAGGMFGVPWQILYGLHYTETGCRNGEIYNRAGSGAQGPMQFMPGTFRAYAVSAHGGVPDINNAEDAIYTAANFLAKHGSWQNGLQAYGGNIHGTLAVARTKGFSE